MPWNENLDPDSTAYQIAAANQPRIRVLAGPGTGKSFAMKRRVARLVESGVAPAAILAVTFTRVAAEDLHRELVSLGVDGADQLSGRTLHSLAMSILGRRHVLTALGRTPRLVNEFELEPLVADLADAHGGVRATKRQISAYEAAWATSPDDNPEDAMTVDELQFSASLTQWLRFHKAMLIGESVPLLNSYLRTNPAAQELNEFDHVLVDEFQDLNVVEQSVVGRLSEHSDVCIVGDDDQSIYSFKHAHPDGIRTWSEDHQAEDYEVDQCRRCPTQVVAAADSLIARNQQRQERHLVPMAENGHGELVIAQFVSIADELAAVANKIEELVAAGVAPGEIIVLAQRKVFALPIVVSLRAASIPVRSYYAETQLDSDAAQERVAILKLVVSREDRVALRWLVGREGSNWNRAGYSRVWAHCSETGQEPWEVLTLLAEGALKIPYTNRLVENFRAVAEEIEALAAIDELNEFVEEWLPNAEEYRLLADLVSGLVMQAESVQDLFEELQAELVQPEVPLEVDEVRVMSLHKSKGLSSHFVFIVGCVEGLHPSRPDQGWGEERQQAAIEEARRLFYVGVTRTKADLAANRSGYLALTYSQQMPVRDALRSGIRPAVQTGLSAHLLPSRFLGELGPTAPAPRSGGPL